MKKGAQLKIENKMQVQYGATIKILEARFYSRGFN